MIRKQAQTCATCRHVIKEFPSTDDADTIHTCTCMPKWRDVDALHYCGQYKPVRPWWHLVR